MDDRLSFGDRRSALRMRGEAPAGARLVWRWLRPWVSGGLLIAAALFGLISASEAETANSSLYWGGLALAVLSAAGLFLRIKHAFDGIDDGLILDARIENSDTLWIFVPVMIAFALAGILIAGTTPPGIDHFFGLALFCVATVFIFLTLKGYYDRQDRRRR